MVIWYILRRLGMLRQEKSGNPEKKFSLEDKCLEQKCPIFCPLDARSIFVSSSGSLKQCFRKKSFFSLSPSPCFVNVSQ
jgi:hypothetical protein